MPDICQTTRLRIVIRTRSSTIQIHVQYLAPYFFLFILDIVTQRDSENSQLNNIS